MQRFFKRYIASLAVLLLAFCCYSFFVVPFVEPEGRERAALPDYQGTVVTDRWWEEFFDSGSWQAGTPQILQTSDGATLLAESIKPLGLKALELKPLTIIVPQEGEDGMSMFIVSADEGAVIDFEKPIDLRAGPMPGLERGQLSGNIFITRKSPGDKLSHTWSLKCRDLVIERNRIYTAEDVAIDWEDGLIRGRDLRIQLKSDLFKSGGSSSSIWGPLEKLELVTIERIQCQLPLGGLWSGLNMPSAKNRPSTSQLPAELQVACGGRFTFDFRRSTAMLTNGVQLVQQFQDSIRDEFTCQQLSVAVEPPRRGNSAAEGYANRKSFGLNDFRLLDLEATGTDQLENFVGEQKVELTAPSIDAFLSAKRLHVDFRKSRVELAGMLNSPVATQSIAVLRYAGFKLQSPRIDYDADGEAPQPHTEHLGYLIADGPGELNTASDSPMGTVQLRWQDRLEMKPSAKPGEQWVGIFGSTLIESRAHGFVASDQIEVWLQKSESVSAPRANAGQLASISGTSLGSSEDSYRPNHIRASGKIAIKTPQIHAKVDKLDLALIFPEKSEVGDQHSNQDAAGGLALQDSAGNPMYQWVGPPGNTAPAGNGAARERKAPASDPVIVIGRTLDSRLVLGNDQSWVDELNISGPLEIIQQPAVETDLPSWKVLGDELSLSTDPAGQVNMNIDGRPARIMFADGYLEGPSIRFDQRNNLLWMDRPGQFTLPIRSNSGSPNASADGSDAAAMAWLEPPHCTWQGGMYFDGRVVHIKDQIRFDASLRVKDDRVWLLNGESEELHIHLAKPLEFRSAARSRNPAARLTSGSDTSSPAREAAIERVVLSDSRGNVNLFAVQYDYQGNEQSRQHIRVPQLTYHALRDELIGQGPGDIRSWHRADRPLGQRAASASSNALLGWQGVHLVFRDHVVADLKRNDVIFEGNVQVAAGPLASPEQRIDLNTMQGLSLGQVLLACDYLHLYDTADLSSNAPRSQTSVEQSDGQQPDALQLGTWEFQARGNVDVQGKVESGDYAATASEIKYVQAKELLLLSGDAHRNAQIRSVPRNNPNVGPVITSIESVAINPRTLEVKTFRIGAGGVLVEGVGSPRSDSAAGSPVLTGQFPAAVLPPSTAPSTLPGAPQGIPPGGDRPVSSPKSNPRSAVGGFLRHNRP